MKTHLNAALLTTIDKLVPAGYLMSIDRASHLDKFWKDLPGSCRRSLLSFTTIETSSPLTMKLLTSLKITASEVSSNWMAVSLAFIFLSLSFFFSFASSTDRVNSAALSVNVSREKLLVLFHLLSFHHFFSLSLHLSSLGSVSLIVPVTEAAERLFMRVRASLMPYNLLCWGVCYRCLLFTSVSPPSPWNLCLLMITSAKREAVNESTLIKAAADTAGLMRRGWARSRGEKKR